ncbi:PAS domain S-box protein [Roseivirga sp.]|uniref:PAS domain S-box protein n=1 Tax=Roseivirga sp. TaxID=1964215 RepID=UPI003B52DFBB
MNPSVTVNAKGEIQTHSFLSTRFLSYLEDENPDLVLGLVQQFRNKESDQQKEQIEIFNCSISYRITHSNDFYTIFFETEDCRMAGGYEDNEKYRLIVEAANEVIYEMNAVGNFTYVNPKTLEITGFSEEEILGKSYLDLIHEDYKQEAKEFYQSQVLNRTKSTFKELPIVTKNGDQFWIGLNVQLLENDFTVTGFLGVGRDITESYNNRLALRQSEEKYRGIIQNLQYGLIEVDNDERIVYANEAMTDITGYEQYELIGEIASELLTDKEAQQILEKEHVKRNSGQASVYEIPVKHKDGSSKWLMISGAPIFDVDGSVKGTIGIHLDITERREAEEELRNTQIRLDKYKNGLEALNNLTANVELSTEDQVTEGLRVAKRYLGLELGVISIIEDDKYIVKHFVSRQKNPGLKTGDQFRLCDTFCEIVSEKDDILYMRDVSESKYSDHPCHHLFGIESYLGISYQVNGKKRGTVNFSSTQPRAEDFDSYDIQFIRLFSKWIGYMISLSENINKQQEDQDTLAEQNRALERNQKYLSGINDFVTSLLDDDSIEEISWEIAENVIDRFGYEDCVIYILNEETQQLEQMAAYGPKQSKDRRVMNPITLPLGKGIVGSVALSGKPEIVSDTSKDARYVVDDARRLSEISVPILADGEVIGVIDSEHRLKNFFNEEHLHTLSTIANLAGNRLKNALAKRQQEKAERDLKDSEQKLRKILDNAIDAVITIDDTGTIKEWNIQAEVIFGFTGKEAIGRKLTETIIPSRHHNAHDRGMKNFLTTGEGPVLNQKIEITALRKSGEEFPIEMAIIPVESQGKHTFTAFLSDITMQKQVHDEMEKALNKERELNELKSRFVSMTSHEFRTPLTTIKQNTDLISYQLENDLPDQFDRYKKFFGRIEGDLNRVTSLMNDILMLGRIEAGKIQVKKKPIDFVAYIEKHIRKFEETDQHGRNINLAVRGVPNHVYIDEPLMDHVVSNLISNALKYSVGKESPEVDLSFNSLDKVKLTVVDHGIGIPAKDMRSLFESFYRATNVKNIQGSGLGLSIVKEFTEMHGGQIHVESEEQVGSKFIVELPLS